MKSLLAPLAVAISNFENYDERYYEDVNNPEVKLDPATRPAKCYALALADATYNGPYQAGALIGLLKSAKPNQEYAVITGLAMGALNGYIMSLYEQKDTEEIINELSKKLYNNF
jgi:predicted acylesterase/phospholipase RssA